MTRFPHDRLSTEERALADRLSQLGPHGGPSPSIDAAILGAARAAASTGVRVRGRAWWKALALPGGMITGIGAAAAFTLAAALIWELRPSERVVLRAPEGGADDGFVAVERVAAPSTSSATASAGTARAAPVPAKGEAARAARPPHAASAPVSGASATSTGRLAQASETPVSDTPQTGQPSIAAESAALASSPRITTPPAAEAAVSPPGTHDSPVQDAGASGTAAHPGTPQRRVTYTTAARARAELPAQRVRPQAGAGPAVDGVRPVTGAPTGLPTAVAADADLEPTEWLGRIRLRRDTGDIDGARESLRRFRRAHPRIPVPRDLRELAR